MKYEDRTKSNACLLPMRSTLLRERWITKAVKYLRFCTHCRKPYMKRTSRKRVVMGSVEGNRYRYNIDTQISFRKSSSRTSHPQISHVFQLSDFELSRLLQHLPGFPVISIRSFFFFFDIFGHCSSDNTKYRYLNKVSIFNDTKGIDTILHH